MREPQGPKSRDKTTHWTAYNAALKSRGSLTIWLDKDMQWYAPASGKRGRQQTFTDAAIQFCLSIKGLFGLAQRQSLGLVQRRLELARLTWRVPGNAGRGGHGIAASGVGVISVRARFVQQSRLA